jgi:hypothetical protein
MEEVKCVILSHKRENNVQTFATVAKCALCVPESQAESYRTNYPKVEYFVHPDSIVGLSAKIKWVYKEIPNVCMIADDITSVKRMYLGSTKDIVNLDPEEAYEVIQITADLAKQIGAKFFGFSKEVNPTAYDVFEPLALSGFVGGGCFGILEGFKMILPDECVASSDFYLSGINAFYHRTTLIDKRFAFISKEGTFISKGGMAEHRNMETEKKDYELLVKAFGQAITLKVKNPLRRLQHQWEKTLFIPF